MYGVGEVAYARGATDNPMAVSASINSTQYRKWPVFKHIFTITHPVILRNKKGIKRKGV